MESNRAPRTMFDTLLENCIFYISQLYEFSHSQGQTRSFGDVGSMSGFRLMTQHAQIAERKYCRPHARPFRLRFARVVAVFPVCSPATSLFPLASAAQYSCRREPCTGSSAWLLLGRACLSAWIEHRSGEQRSP